MSHFGDSLLHPVERVLHRGASALGRKDLFYRGFQHWRRPRAEIAALAGAHAGQRCFLLGGGPSIRSLDPEPLRGELTFGVNGIFLIFDWLGFQPTYYTVEDRLVYEDRFHDIRERVTDSICLFPTQFARPDFDRSNHRYFRAAYEFSGLPDWPPFSLDPSRLVWIGGTVMYVCLQLALYMGCDPIYLLGVDLDYQRPGHVAAEGNEWTSHGDDPNHFHPDYFGKGYRWHDPRPERMELAFGKARRVADGLGRRIYNASPGGKLEVFERVSYDALF